MEAHDLIAVQPTLYRVHESVKRDVGERVRLIKESSAATVAFQESLSHWGIAAYDAVSSRRRARVGVIAA